MVDAVLVFAERHPVFALVVLVVGVMTIIASGALLADWLVGRIEDEDRAREAKLR